jgi:hypothetical protein
VNISSDVAMLRGVSKPTPKEKRMSGSNSGRVAVGGEEAAPGDGGAPRRLRIRFEEGAWRLSEDLTDRIGGRFSSLSSAVDFARAELRGLALGYIVLELGAPASAERPDRRA